jgi:hypothetical protein
MSKRSIGGASPQKVRVLLLEPDRPPVIRELSCDPEADFRQAIDCDHVGYVSLPGDIAGYIDEVGKIRPDGPRPENVLATMVCQRLGCLDPSGWIAGPMAIIGVEGEEGDERSVPDWIARYIRRVYRDPLGAVPKPVEAIDWYEMAAAAIRDKNSKEHRP